MGLINFLKDAGSKIFGEEEEKNIEEQRSEPDFDDEKYDRRRADAMQKKIESFDFEVERLAIAVEGDVVTVHGTVPDQETREKIVLALGNQAGVGGVADELEVVEEDEPATYYTVESGDTLWKISEAHYGKGARYMEIFEANTPLLSDPNRIYPGQVLRIPPLEKD